MERDEFVSQVIDEACRGLGTNETLLIDVSSPFPFSSLIVFFYTGRVRALLSNEEIAIICYARIKPIVRKQKTWKKFQAGLRTAVVR